ncbi:9620_t:CDS:2, partial [Acaulospora colombiana]
MRDGEGWLEVFAMVHEQDGGKKREKNNTEFMAQPSPHQNLHIQKNENSLGSSTRGGICCNIVPPLDHGQIVNEPKFAPRGQ